MTEASLSYDRDLLLAVLIAHQRNSTHSCQCGWDDLLGHAHPEHVIEMYEQVAGDALPACDRKVGCVLPDAHSGPCVQVLRR
jgi:hypothetical protein